MKPSINLFPRLEPAVVNRKTSNRSRCELANLAKIVLLLIVTFGTTHRASAISLTLDDHATRPWFDAPSSAFDWASPAKVIIVTGTPNWPYNNVNLTNVRVCDAQGVPIIASLNIPQGTPLGTVIYSADVFNPGPTQFAVGTTIWGYPHHIETYYGDPNPYVGDATGGGWTITHTNSGDGGWNGCDPVCGIQIPSGDDQIWTVYAGPATTPPPSPTPGANTKGNDAKSGGNQCSGTPPPMARYSVHSMLVSLNIEDRPLRYSPAFGPSVDFTVTYNQREKSARPVTNGACRMDRSRSSA